MKKTISGVHMFILMQKDLEKALIFYEKLGAKKTLHIPDKWAEMEFFGIKLGLCPFEDATPRHTGVVLEVVDLESLYADLKKEGISFTGEPVEALHGSLVTFEDPSGNRLDLYQPHLDRLDKVLGKCCKKDADQVSCCKTR